ncbi:lactate utilization protein [Chloroflexota bacterium]
MMVDETNLEAEKSWFYQEQAGRVVTNLQKNNVNAQYVPTRKEALQTILAMIPEGTTVSRGDSISLDEVGVIPELGKRGVNKLIPLAFTRDAEGNYVYSADERYKLEREVFFSDIFLTGTNAVTLDGKLVNTDGYGNRAAPMFFGPKKVIIVAGVNKIVRDVDEALARIHGYAAPINTRRHYLKHNHPEYATLPCVVTGKCVDCRHQCRICCYTVIIDFVRHKEKGRIDVVLVGEELGI